MLEIEVYRMTPKPGVCYATALYTQRVGYWPNEKYYTTNKLRYLGEFFKSESFGGGNGGRYFEYFDDNGKVNKLEYDYEGRTCLIEVPCGSMNGGRSIRKTTTKTIKQKNKRVKQRKTHRKL